MAELLLINPRRRKAAKKTTKRRVRRAVAVRRANPVPAALAGVSKRRARRRNPVGLSRVHAKRRRRNPVGTVSTSGVMGMLKQAAIGGAGAIAVDVVMGQVNAFLPASMQSTNAAVDVNDAVKIGITIAAGRLLNKATRGLSQKMAIGALTVQASDILRNLAPASMALGYATPGKIVQGTQRVNPIMQRVGAYTSGASPMLNAYQNGGSSSMLSGARSREGVQYR